MIYIIAESAGITAMSAAVYLIKSGVKPSDITLHTKTFGGEWSKGGLKIINYTRETKDFIANKLGIDYSLKRVNGAVHWNSDIIPFPECFREDKTQGFNIQKMYWNKTRPDSEFDQRCMNEPWTKQMPELKIVPLAGVANMISIMELITKANINIVLGETDEHLLKRLVEDKNNIVIYTMPVPLLLGTLGIDAQQEMTKATLTIRRYTMDQKDVRKVWWDYLYIPQKQYPFHRLSISGDELHVESNSDIGSIDMWKPLCELLNGTSGVYPKKYIDCTDINIKGQISKDLTQSVLDKIPNNVVLLGRYAEWNKRVTWDKVLKKLHETLCILE